MSRLSAVEKQPGNPQEERAPANLYGPLGEAVMAQQMELAGLRERMRLTLETCEMYRDQCAAFARAARVQRSRARKSSHHGPEHGAEQL